MRTTAHDARPRIPFLRPDPPRLSTMVAELRAIEQSGIYSNFGPVNARLEAALTAQLFGGRGACVTVNNATSGLMLAIREARDGREERRYALMPAFTFAATAHAAIWAGLTPLFCDIDADSWLSGAASEDGLLDTHAGEVACLVPYACFGNILDLERYARIAELHDVGVVIDAAASLGSRDAAGQPFGVASEHPVVYSMHATKTFATAEAGVVHCADKVRIDRLRRMANFGFDESRSSMMPGLNAKLSEVGALLGLARLADFEPLVEHRAALARRYRELLGDVDCQRAVGARLAYQFMPALLPPGWGARRPAVIERLAARGIETRTYFSPHLAEQPYFARVGVSGDLPVTRDVSARALSLPMADAMTVAEVEEVCGALHGVMQELA